MTIAHYDTIVVGAGLSGIAAAYRMKTERPGKTYTILESRSEIGLLYVLLMFANVLQFPLKLVGGTWSLFQYPGIRSDSDMYTLVGGWSLLFIMI